MKLKQLFSAIIIMSLALTMACTDDDPVETVFADPTITIEAPDGEVLVGGTVTLSVTVEAEAGLSSVSLNGDNIKTYSQGEITDTFDHEFVPVENGTVSLVFVVEDSKGTTIESETVSVEAVGDPGFLLADFGGAAGSNVTLSTIDPDHWDADRTITTFDVNGNLSTSATFENVNDQFTIETGVENPDANAAIEYQGKAMKVVKNPAGWGTAGWSHIMFDFGTTLDKADVEALPQVNAEQTGLTAGTKVVEIDVYYADSDGLPFASMIGDNVIIGDNPAFGSDKSQGYSFFLMLTKHADHRLNPDGSGMYIGYEEYITEANKWVTLRFDDLYFESVGNFFASGNEDAATSDVVDGIKIVAGGGYGDGQSDNAIYFRNLRIVDVD